MDNYRKSLKMESQTGIRGYPESMQVVTPAPILLLIEFCINLCLKKPVKGETLHS